MRKSVARDLQSTDDRAKILAVYDVANTVPESRNMNLDYLDHRIDDLDQQLKIVIGQRFNGEGIDRIVHHADGVTKARISIGKLPCAVRTRLMPDDAGGVLLNSFNSSSSHTLNITPPLAGTKLSLIKAGLTMTARGARRLPSERSLA